MKKKAMIVASVIVLIVLCIVLFSCLGTVTDKTKIENIQEVANLNLIINLGEFDANHYDNAKLLDVAMQYAEKLGMLNTYDDENSLIEYVTKDDLHTLIYELTGITVDAPIEIEDFYYLYDGENDFYYYRPSTPSYYSIDKINSVKEQQNSYHISCDISKTEDTEVSRLENIQISLTYMPQNEYVKYRVNKVSY